MPIYLQAVLGACISFCVGIITNARVKISFYGAIFGGICYFIYALCDFKLIGYFLGTLSLAFLSEAATKFLKTPSTVFLIIGIYPLVPGGGIYRTITLLIQSDYIKALETGAKTFSEIILMTTAIAIVSTVSKNIIKHH